MRCGVEPLRTSVLVLVQGLYSGAATLLDRRLVNPDDGRRHFFGSMESRAWTTTPVLTKTTAIMELISRCITCATASRREGFLESSWRMVLVLATLAHGLPTGRRNGDELMFLRAACWPPGRDFRPGES